MNVPEIVTVIPSRLGSNRIPMKGMRLLKNKTLVEHTASAIIKSKYLSKRVFINSDAKEWSELANELGIEFYHRESELATSKSMIDDYLYDFINNVKADYLAVITPTSPFITAADLDKAWEAYESSSANTLISAEAIQTHCYYKGKSLNFSCNSKLPRSQDLEPIHALNFSIAIYNCAYFKKAYEEYGFAVLSGEIQTFILDGFATIDIDEEKDFILAELAFEYQNNIEKYKPQYSRYVQDIINEGKNTKT